MKTLSKQVQAMRDSFHREAEKLANAPQTAKNLHPSVLWDLAQRKAQVEAVA